jgi:hypothetical protein
MGTGGARDGQHQPEVLRPSRVTTDVLQTLPVPNLSSLPGTMQ